MEIMTMEIFTVKIIRNKKAPVQMHSKCGRSKWRDTFEAMDVGHWFLVPKRHQGSVANAATLYLKGRYSLYKHPITPETYVFRKNK
jgi:hypothetical protein